MWSCAFRATWRRTAPRGEGPLRANSKLPSSRPPERHTPLKSHRIYGHHHLPSPTPHGHALTSSTRSLGALFRYFWLALLLLTILPFLATAQPFQAGPPFLFMNGGPGQDLSFYGYQSAAAFPLQGTTSPEPTFTLEFWVAPRCSNIKCTFFTLQSSNANSLYCFGQKFVLTDGAVAGLSGSPPWDLFADPAPPSASSISSRGIDIREFWYHFAFSANATAGTCSVFVNGTKLVTASLPSPPADNQRQFFGPNSLLVLGQLYLRGSTSTPERVSFQGSYDEIRLWSSERFPGPGMKTMRRSLLSQERTSSLLAYWSMDTEPFLLATSAIPTINDTHGSNTGYLVPVEELDGPFPSPFQSFATFGPSTAPVITENAPRLLHINLTSIIRIPLRYMCIDDQSGDTLNCPPNLTKKLYSIPGAGKVSATNETTQQLFPLGSANNTTRQNSLAYEPIEFLLVANDGQDSFRWGLEGNPPNLSTRVQIYSPPTTAISTWISPLGTPSSPIVAFNSIPTVIHLQCGSRLGDSSVPAIITAPSSGQLQQVLIRNTTQSIPGVTTTQPGSQASWSYVPTGQLIPCADPLQPDPSCIVSHYSNSIIFQPTILDTSPSLNLSLTYICISAPLTGFSAAQAIPITWSISTSPTQVTYDSTMVGPNPFSLKYDGFWSEMTTTFRGSTSLSAVSLWIAPMKLAKYIYDDNFNISTFSESKTLLQLLPSNTTLFGGLELTLDRNISSPHLYLTLAQWSSTTNRRTAQPIASITTMGGPVWVDSEGWTNVILTYSPNSPGTMVIYIDGFPAASGSFPNQYSFSPARMALGHSLVNPQQNTYSGLLDEVTVWSRPFGPFDALDRQYVAIDPANPDLIAYWDFNEGLGSVATDQLTGLQLKPSTVGPVRMPLWSPATGLPFGDLEMNSNIPKIVTLATHQTAGYDKWQLGTYVVKLPQYGTLYQYPTNWTNIESALLSARRQAATQNSNVNYDRFEYEKEHDDDFGQHGGDDHRGDTDPGHRPKQHHGKPGNHKQHGPRGHNQPQPAPGPKRTIMDDIRQYLEPITGPFANSPSTVPMVYQWVSRVLVASSSRSAPAGTNWWSPEQLLGPPSWWDPDPSFDSISYGRPLYGESTQSWCPAAQCPGGAGNIEFAHVEFEKPIFLRKIEVFQNLNPGAVTRILAWDPVTNQWRSIYQASPSFPGVAYSTLIPQFCGISSFKTNVLRIELNPCTNPGWYEIEAIRISGTETLPAGVVSDPIGRVLYIPDAYLQQVDAITYTASECPYTLPSASPSFRYQLRIAASSALPQAQSQNIKARARDFTPILLYASSPDPSAAEFRRIVTSTMKHGELFQAVEGPDGLEPGPEISNDGSGVLVSNAKGYVFFRAPSICKFNLATFSYFVSTQGQISQSATISIDSLCPPSFLNFRLGVLVTMLVIIVLAIAFAMACVFITILKRKEKIFADERPPVLLSICFGAIVSYASLFMFLAPITIGWCLAQMWVLHLGVAIVIAGALALTLSKWNDFSVQALRSGKGSQDLPSSTVFVVVLSMMIEIALLAIFTLINTPHVKTIVSPDNPAITIAKCETKLFSNYYLLVSKAFWMEAIFIISCIFYSVSPTIIRSCIVMLSCSVIGILSGIGFTVAISKVFSPTAELILNILAVTGPISLFLFILYSDKWKRAQASKQTVVETSEFGLQPISPQKPGTRPKATSQLQDTVAATQMTISMNNHSVDKSVSGLLDMVQDKEREIAVLKRKLLKKHYRIRELQQKLAETADSSMQMFSTGQDYD